MHFLTPFEKAIANIRGLQISKSNDKLPTRQSLEACLQARVHVCVCVVLFGFQVQNRSHTGTCMHLVFFLFRNLEVSLLLVKRFV